MAAATMGSRVLGLLREMAYARFMGDGWVAGAFMLAFMVPNLFRRFLGEGALTAAFIPLFKEKEKNAGEAAMWRSANAVISGLVVTAGGIIVLGVIGITIALAIFNFETQTVLMLRLLRVMAPYILLVCLAAIFMGMLNARGHFFVPALGAAMLNVVMIASVFWFAPWFGTDLPHKIFGLAIGVVIAGFVQTFFQWPQLRREGFRYGWIRPWGNPDVRRVVRQMIPGAIGVAAFQINVLTTQGLAFWIDPSVIASFNYAVRLMELPQGVFGISLATFLLPTLAGLAVEKKYEEYRQTLSHGVAYLVFVNLLASVLLAILAKPIVRLLFEHGLFDEAATHRAALALTCLAPGLVAFSLVNILARAFYALSDTKTPMKISVFCLLLNIVLSAGLIWNFRQAGLGLANTLSAVCNTALLIYALRRKMPKLAFAELRQSALPLLGAAVVAGLGAWVTYWGIERTWGHQTLVPRIAQVFLPMIVATSLYLGITLWQRIPVATELLTFLQRNKRS